MANGLPYFENNIYCRRDDVSQCQPGSLMPPYRTAAIQMTHLFDSSDSPRSQSESTLLRVCLALCFPRIALS